MDRFFKGQQNHLVKLADQGTIPAENPETGEDSEDTIVTASLEKQISVFLDIQVEYTVQKEITAIRKKYRLHHSWKDETTP